MTEYDFKKIDNPIAQGVVIFTGAFALMLGAWLLTVSGIYPAEPLFAWSVATAFTLLFALLNSLMSLRADSFARYWGRSMYTFIGLAFSTGLAAWMFSGIPLRDAGTYRWIFIVISIGFLVFLSMVNFMKKIVQFAEREEWNEPRKRN